MTIDPDRLQLLVLARAHTSAGPLSAARHAAALQRFAPADTSAAGWRAAVDAALAQLIAQRVLGATHEVTDREALGRALGLTGPRTWAQLTDRALPALGLGLAASDGRTLERLDSRDAWAAAIGGRALGLWTQGPPPTLPALCDQLTWRRLGLTGKVKRLPEEVRALFLQRELDTTPGPTDRLLRLLAARELGVPRTELRALRDALVRHWLQRRVLGGPEGAPVPPAPTREAAPPTEAAARHPEDAFVAELRAALARVQAGTFGARKVFISAAWEELRRSPGWAELSLDELKARLLIAHRAGQLELARADMISAMDPRLVDASTTHGDGATFHFIIREGS